MAMALTALIMPALLHAADQVVTGTISGVQAFDSPEGIIFNAAVMGSDARVTATANFEVHLGPGTLIADGARFSVTMRDNDGLGNRWEFQYFGNLGQNPGDDPDGDGLTNLAEYQAGATSPINPDTDGDGIFDDCEAPYDRTAPIITLIGANTVSLCLGDTYNDAGATANDDCLGSITPDIAVVNPVNTNVRGTYLITYNVQDGAGNAAAQITRTVNVDIQPPVLSLTGDNPFSICMGDTYVEPGVTASDNCDADIASRLVVSGPVNSSQPGSYTVTYNVTDSAGNAAQPLSRTVLVIGPGQTIQIDTTYQYDGIGRLRTITRQVR